MCKVARTSKILCARAYDDGILPAKFLRARDVACTSAEISDPHPPKEKIHLFKNLNVDIFGARTKNFKN